MSGLPEQYTDICSARGDGILVSVGMEKDVTMNIGKKTVRVMDHGTVPERFRAAVSGAEEILCISVLKAADADSENRDTA